MYPDPDQVVLPHNTYPPCDFCAGKTLGDRYNTPNYCWNICLDANCWIAANAQRDRIYAGLVDCEETRRHALQWVNRDKKKK